MKLQIDNLDGAGPRDYTDSIDAAHAPLVTRKLNQPAELRFSLLQIGANFIVPVRGARVLLGRSNGQDVFTGYVAADPEYEYLGWGERGVMYRYTLVARSDEAQLDEKLLPARSPFVARSAGDALRQLTRDARAGVLDTSGVQDLDVLPSYVPDAQLPWSTHAASISILARGSYRALNGALRFAPIGSTSYTLDETDPSFSAQGFSLQALGTLVNDAIVIGEVEPQDFARDYFVGDGFTTRYYLSQTPFTKTSRTIFNEEYAGTTLDQTRWSATDPASVMSLNSGKLQIAGGTGVDGATTVTFVEKIELGGGWVLQHGDVLFTAASAGILGGLYLGAISQPNCLAGFQITPSGPVSTIQALVNGSLSGAPLTTTAGHHYVLTTRIYSQTLFRQQQTFHSAANPAGSGLGGAQVVADVRLVLEVHEIDPANPATQIAASSVLYDGLISGAPAYCTYALVNSTGLQCAVAFTRLLKAPDVEVRTALPGNNFRSRLVGPLSSGGECNVVSGPTLTFFSRYVPALNEYVEVHYRASGRALARVINPVSIASEQHGTDDGVRASVRHLKLPPGRTSSDCENAAIALLSDGASIVRRGKYQAWSDFLPGGAQDIFPGDALSINVPACQAVFSAIVKVVTISVVDLAGEHSSYELQFEENTSQELGFEFESQSVAAALNLVPITTAQVGTTTLPNLMGAAITAVDSTTATIDAGITPLAGGGVEVRWSDAGWGPYNDQNLAGRFTAQTFTLPRLGKVEDYYLRQYDASSPPKYSRYTAALHVDYPF